MTTTVSYFWKRYLKNEKIQKKNRLKVVKKFSLVQYLKNRFATVIESPGKSWSRGKQFHVLGSLWIWAMVRENPGMGKKVFFTFTNNNNKLFVQMLCFDNILKQKCDSTRLHAILSGSNSSKAICHWLFFIVRILKRSVIGCFSLLGF